MTAATASDTAEGSNAPAHPLPQLAIEPSVAHAVQPQDAVEKKKTDANEAPSAPDDVTVAVNPEPGSVEPIKPSSKRATACTDWLMFLALIGMVGLFIFVSVRGVSGLGIGVALPLGETAQLEWMKRNLDVPEWLWPERRAVFVHHGLTMAAIAFALSLAVSLLLVSAPRFVLQTVAWTAVAGSLGATIFLFVTTTWYYGVAGIVSFMLYCRFAMRMAPLIEFVVANLHVAVTAVHRHRALYGACLAVFGLQLAWIWCSITTFIRVAQYIAEQKAGPMHTGLPGGAACRYSSTCASGTCTRTVPRRSNETSSTMVGVCTTAELPAMEFTDYLILVAVVLACLWGLLVLRNICHATVARVVAGFWHGDVSWKLTVTSLGRSCGSTLGSISLISLCVVICEAILFVLDKLINRLYSHGKEKCNEWLGKLTGLFNRWTLVYVGVYGHSVRQASRSVGQLFVQRGFTAIVEADLMNQLMNGAASAVAMAALAISATALQVDFNDSYVSDAISVIVGFSIGLTPLVLIDSACAAVFVCFTEDPSALREHHPELYESLATAWRKLYPAQLSLNGYY